MNLASVCYLYGRVELLVEEIRFCLNNLKIPLNLFLFSGSTHDCAYILYCVLECDRLGYRSVVVNPRGLGGIPLKVVHQLFTGYFVVKDWDWLVNE